MSSDVRSRRYHLAKRPEGVPDEDVFSIQETELGAPDPGELLGRILYLSVDPYMRDRMREGESYSEPWEVGDPLRGGIVAEVIQANGTNYDPGDLVVGNGPWAEYALLDGARMSRVRVGELPVPTALGVLGMPGRTAYFGTREVARPKAGDTVVVSGAAGAVGSVAGQLAGLQGARVVGIAGTDEKLEWIVDECGFDAGINYRTENVTEALDERVPEGVDVYYDNVGGPITDAVFQRLNLDARVAVCGQIALYNNESVPKGPRKLPSLIETRATISGFLVRDFSPRYSEATTALRQWVAAGDLVHRETVTEGLENAPNAFLGLFEGTNIGKQLVKIADPGERD